MADDIAAIASDLRGILDRLAAIERQPQTAAPSRGDEHPDRGLKDLILAADAADLAHRAKKTMNAWCRRHPISGEVGFALQIGRRWFVSRSRLIRYLENENSSGSGH